MVVPYSLFIVAPFFNYVPGELEKTRFTCVCETGLLALLSVR